MKDTKEIFNILPQNLKRLIEGVEAINLLQEIRLRVNKPLILQIGNGEMIIDYNCTADDVRVTLQRISNYSIYAFEEELKQGYLTIKGGHRIGIFGSCVIDNNQVKTIKDVAFLNIRISREVIGCSDFVMPYILERDGVINTIIISPPRCGKTTLIRDITRNISQGISKYHFQGKKVSVIDERSEIGACYAGVPQMQLGIRTDVIDNCPKSQGIIMAIRSMSPDVVVCDEIGTYSDVESILLALNSGVSLITTIHGYGIEDLFRRPVFNEILENKVFHRAVVLSAANGVGTIEYIYDFNKNEKLWRKQNDI